MEREQVCVEDEEPQRYVSTYSVRASPGAHLCLFYSLSAVLESPDKGYYKPRIVGWCHHDALHHGICMYLTLSADAVVPHVVRMNWQSGSTMLSGLQRVRAAVEARLPIISTSSQGLGLLHQCSCMCQTDWFSLRVVYFTHIYSCLVVQYNEENGV